MGEKEFAALQQDWFRRLTTCGAVTAAGFTALLAGLGVWLHVTVLLIGAAILGAVFLVTLIALPLGRRGRLLAAAQLLAIAGVAHAIIQSYLFPFAASVLAVSVVFSVACVLPYVHGRPLRWLVVGSILSSLAIATLPQLSPFRDVVPHAAQQLIAMAALPAVTILTALLLLQFAERIRYTREAESAAHAETEQTRRVLEQTGQRLQIALATAGIGIWVMDLDTGATGLDDRCRRFCHDARGFLNLAGSSFESVDPDLIQCHQTDRDNRVNERAFDLELFGDEHSNLLDLLVERVGLIGKDGSLGLDSGLYGFPETVAVEKAVRRVDLVFQLKIALHRYPVQRRITVLCHVDKLL